MTRLEERTELEALRRGDEAVFRSLTERLFPTMVRVALIYVADRATAEEVVQDTWLAVLRGLDGFEERSSLKTWIFRILTNRAKTRALRERRTIPFSALANPGLVQEPALEPDRFRSDHDPIWPGHWASPPRAWAGPAERLSSSELRTRILDAIDSLPAAQRAVITMRDVAGWSSEEVCNALEITETNQRVLLHRARSKVRRALEGYLEEDVP